METLKNIKTGDVAKVSPEITGLEDWVEGIVITIRKNPFLGLEVAIKDKLGRIFFGEQMYFKPL